MDYNSFIRRASHLIGLSEFDPEIPKAHGACGLTVNHIFYLGEAVACIARDQLLTGKSVSISITVDDDGIHIES